MLSKKIWMTVIFLIILLLIKIYKYEVYYRTLVKVYSLIDIECDLREKVEEKSGFRVS